MSPFYRVGVGRRIYRDGIRCGGSEESGDGFRYLAAFTTYIAATVTTTQVFRWVMVCSVLGLVLSGVCIHDNREFFVLETPQQRQTKTGRTARRATKKSTIVACRHARIPTTNTDINDDDDDDDDDDDYDDNDNGFNKTETSLVGYSDIVTKKKKKKQ